MTFEETLQFLREQEGRWVEVSVSIPLPGREEGATLVSFSGQVGNVRQSGARNLPEAWYVWMRQAESSPGPEMLRVDRDLFETADVEANVVPAEERAESGATWTLTIRQRGVLTVVEVYV